MNLLDKISTAEKEKDAGNEEFKKGDLRKAIKKYHISLLYLKNLETPSPLDGMSGNEPIALTDNELTTIKSIRCICYNNLSACLLKKKNFEKVVEYTNQVLENDKTNTKALFRRGQAHYSMNNIDKAKDDFLEIKRINSSETCVDKYFPLIENAMRKQHQADRDLYRKMMSYS